MNRPNLFSLKCFAKSLVVMTVILLIVLVQMDPTRSLFDVGANEETKEETNEETNEGTNKTDVQPTSSPDTNPFIEQYYTKVVLPCSLRPDRYGTSLHCV